MVMTADRHVDGRPLLRVRDVELLQHLAAGRSTAQIARSMGLSGNTVRTRIRRVAAKLSAGSRADAVSAAAAHGVL
jgi:DNA-binding CsgD family transcriptional regulator